MPALRPRTVFAASFVMTVAACSKKSEPKSEPNASDLGPVWNINKRGAVCFADQPMHCSEGASCNPPPPRQMPCPPGIDKRGYARMRERGEHDCYLVPEGCMQESCATQKVRCPYTYQEVTELSRPGTKEPDGHCVAYWVSPIASHAWFVIPCPAETAAKFVITREDLDKPCVADGLGVPTHEIPCPVEPKVFASAAELRRAYAADRSAFANLRVQVRGAAADLEALGCALGDLANQTSLVVDGVPGDGSGGVALADCAIWVY